MAPQGSDHGDLELAVRACSVASIASFNSEEGFGSPSNHRRAKNRHAPPEVADSSFEVGSLASPWGLRIHPGIMSPPDCPCRTLSKPHKPLDSVHPAAVTVVLH